MQLKSRSIYVIIGLLAAVLSAKVPVAIAWGTFRAPSGQTRLEVYLGLDRFALDWRDDGDHQVARAAAVVMVKRRGAIIAFKELEVVDRRPQAPGRIPKQATFTLKPGKYDLQVVVEDWQGSLVDTTLALEITSWGRTGIQISSLQPAYLISPNTTRPEFTRQGLMVLPNAAGDFSDHNPLLWYYTELYGLTPQDSILLKTTITRDSQEVSIGEPRMFASAALTLREWGAVNLSGYEPGAYHLDLRVTVNADTVSAGARFQVLPADTPRDSSLAHIDLAPGLAAVWPRFDPVRYQQADSAIQAQLLARTITRLARTVERDSANYLEELTAHWPLARLYDPGWAGAGRLSERGRVILLYGLPTAIQQYPASGSRGAYQVWDYTASGSGGVIVLSDLTGRGRETLVHGTLPGTPFDAGWQGILPVRYAAAPVLQPEVDSLETVGGEITATDSVVAAPVEQTVDTTAADTTGAELIEQPVDTTAADTTGAELIEQPADTTAADSTGAELIEQPADTAAIDTTAIEPEEQDQEQPEPTAPVTEPTALPADTTAGEIDAAIEAGSPDSSSGDTSGPEPAVGDTSTTD